MFVCDNQTVRRLIWTRFLSILQWHQILQSFQDIGESEQPHGMAPKETKKAIQERLKSKVRFCLLKEIEGRGMFWVPLAHLYCVRSWCLPMIAGAVPEICQTTLFWFPSSLDKVVKGELIRPSRPFKVVRWVPTWMLCSLSCGHFHACQSARMQ
jgi:hypothetical protein